MNEDPLFPSLRIPCSTYRLQFNSLFTFKQALSLVSYFHELGISDLYASPLMKSKPGSSHGYDVLDCNQLNPEVGSEEEFEKWVTALQKKQMGLILDIVPNHMSIAGGRNKWWQEVLENGPSSLYAHYFDIVWNPPKAELKNRILLPILDQPYGKVIENQELKLLYLEGAFFVEYKGQQFPLNPLTYPLILNHALHFLGNELEDSHPDLIELKSLLTALHHLPSIEERKREKQQEKNREKEIIKKRLAHLVNHSSLIFQAIHRSLQLFNGQKGDPRSFDLLEELLKGQAYRLSFWRVTNDEINYRRFFEINELVSMHVEKEDVFAAMHEWVLKAIEKRWVTALRLDHVDGLLDPEQYFIRLQRLCAKAWKEKTESVSDRPFFLLLEKILGGEEWLPSQWPIFGTTGYDVLNLLNGLFVRQESREKMEESYHAFIGNQEEMNQTIYTCKKLILFISMSSELHLLSRHLEEISEQHRWSRDYTLEALRSALRDVIACFPVYRSYSRAEENEIRLEDWMFMTTAIRQAKRLNPARDPSIFDFIESVLVRQDPPGLTPKQIHYRRDFILHFQQLTGPVMAKGVEDTAFYRNYPLASLNEVGAPEWFGVSLETFHQKNEERLEKWPHTLIATSTHDTKRSEDVRARLNVLSEDPVGWEQALLRWHLLNKTKKVSLDHRPVPDKNEEYLFYQTLIGTWPFEQGDLSAAIRYQERIEQYIKKAIKEAKIHTSWIYPNEAYEKGMSAFIRQVLEQTPDNLFIQDFEQFIQPIMRAGLFNSLSQTLLKLTIPGIPDFYQGSELWQLTLVDPDNRHPIDYSHRQQLLRELKEKGKGEEGRGELVTHLMETLQDGRIKLYLISQLLQYRNSHPVLFREGGYQPLAVKGERANHVMAFSRKKEQEQILIATGRFYLPLLRSAKDPIGKCWGETTLQLSSEYEGMYRDLLTGQTFLIEQKGAVAFQELFSKLPMVALEKLRLM